MSTPSTLLESILLKRIQYIIFHRREHCGLGQENGDNVTEKLEFFLHILPGLERERNTQLHTPNFHYVYIFVEFSIFKIYLYQSS